jgi:hypothetical protein
MRGYMRVVLCFPFEDAGRPSAVLHLRSALHRLSRLRPDLAGSISTGPDGHVQGCVFLQTSPGDEIRFEHSDISDEFEYGSFDDLQRAEFPPAAFVHPRFALAPATEDGGLMGIAAIKAFFIKGGLLLAVFYTHAIADGDGLRMLIEAVAAQTRDDPVPSGVDCLDHRTAEAQSERQFFAGSKIEDILPLCPEYAILDTPVGPTAPRPRPGGTPADDIKKIGKTFVFDNEKLKELRRRLQHITGEPAPPSNYVTLAALTWAYATKARLADEAYVSKGTPDTPAKLQTMVNWKSRVDPPMTNHAGNATAVAVTAAPTRSVAAAAAAGEAGLAGLAALTRAIARTITGVDSAFVATRARLFAALPDPRLLGLAFDPRTAQDLGFNTWRYFGADVEFAIPGALARTPAAVRRAQDAWNMSGALILPAREGSGEHALLVTLPVTAMEKLVEEEGWRRWVDRVVG